VGKGEVKRRKGGPLGGGETERHSGSNSNINKRGGKDVRMLAVEDQF